MCFGLTIVIKHTITVSNNALWMATTATKNVTSLNYIPIFYLNNLYEAKNVQLLGLASFQVHLCVKRTHMMGNPLYSKLNNVRFSRSLVIFLFFFFFLLFLRPECMFVFFFSGSLHICMQVVRT